MADFQDRKILPRKSNKKKRRKKRKWRVRTLLFRSIFLLFFLYVLLTKISWNEYFDLSNKQQLLLQQASSQATIWMGKFLEGFQFILKKLFFLIKELIVKIKERI